MTLMRRMRLILLVSVILLPLTGCMSAQFGSAAPVLKVGLIAPFEGLGRPLGYAVLPAVQEALTAANASGTLGPYRLLLVALNDDLDPVAARAQAAALAQDPAVIAVIGPFTMATADAATPVLAHAGIPAVIPAPLTSPADGVMSLCPPVEKIGADLRGLVDLEGLLDGAARSVNLRGCANLRFARNLQGFSCSHYAIDIINSVDSHNTPRAMLSEARRVDSEPLVFFPGGAAEAADQLLARRAAGRTGTLIGGPDVVKPWFVERAGAAGEGTRAAACAVRGAAPQAGELPEVGLARTAAELIIQAIVAEVGAGEAPTQAGVAARLARQPVGRELLWYEVSGGAWQPMENR